MVLFIEGAIMMCYVTAGLLFFRFFRKTHDALFCYFGIAFAVLGLTRVAFLFIDPAHEARTWIYVLRLLAFAVILWALVEKNWGRRKDAEARRS